MHSVKEFREKYGLSQAEAGTALNCDKNTVRRYETGIEYSSYRETPPTIRALINFFAASGVSPVEKTDAKRMTPDEFIKARQALNLTQKQLADLIGVDSTTIFRWENGTYEPSAPASRLLRLWLKFGIV